MDQLAGEPQSGRHPEDPGCNQRRTQAADPGVRTDMTNTTRDINALAQEVEDFLFAGGTVADMFGLKMEELEPVYAHGFSLYNQARWSEALQVFSFLTYHSHLEQRFHVARG